jgi:NhaA family Na+:H+ antiporter
VSEPERGAPRLPQPWSASDRLVARTIVRPLRRFADTEAASGVLMLAMAIVAMVWANSPAADSYEEVWSTLAVVEIGDWLHLELTAREWVNDLFMAFFFFVVALEIKRELVRGELRDPRAAALPAIAALGGMVVPAGVYALFNAGGPGADGWGIPMATDIAFAVGVLSLVGRRVPPALVVFLLSLAIVDDLGAIVVIAIFYTSDLALGWLAVAAGTIGVAFALKRVDVRSLVPYFLLAALCWLALHESGVHATLAGVAFGLLAPSRAFYALSEFRVASVPLLRRLDQPVAAGEDIDADDAETLARLTHLAHEAQPPLDRLEHRLVPWTSFLVVPVFALANAGVRVTPSELVDAFSEPVTLGVLFGLVVGKTVGVFGFALAAIALGIGKMPAGARRSQLLGVAMLAGIGFTVALFVTELAFGQGGPADLAKIGILVASLAAGLLGWGFLRFVGRRGRPARDVGPDAHHVPSPAGRAPVPVGG